MAGCADKHSEAPRTGYALIIHGGAGTIERGDMSAEQEREYHAALRSALEAGRAVLAEGGTSLDAAVAAIVLMEESPLFNAGKGAVFTAAGKNELDASIMDGKTRNAGAVAGVTTVRSPIQLARVVMDKSPHVMLQGAGADAFAREHGLATVEPGYFRTERRWQQHRDRLGQDDKPADGAAGKPPAGEAPAEGEGDNPSGRADSDRTGALHGLIHDHAFGTVGAVALDRHGNLAAATSTGGMTNKRWGRVGDSPIIGAGTYADNRSCAVSGTGHGEYFIRAGVARDICARVEYQGLSIEAAARAVVHDTLVAMGGDGGVIAMDGRGQIALVFNTKGMYRGQVSD
ncbi:MAG: isoaspartyl peptidase/L-asparaginase, partial [Myxococcota bacterium]